MLPSIDPYVLRTFVRFLIYSRAGDVLQANYYAYKLWEYGIEYSYIDGHPNILEGM